MWLISGPPLTYVLTDWSKQDFSRNQNLKMLPNKLLGNFGYLSVQSTCFFFFLSGLAGCGGSLLFAGAGDQKIQGDQPQQQEEQEEQSETLHYTIAHTHTSSQHPWEHLYNTALHCGGVGKTDGAESIFIAATVSTVAMFVISSVFICLRRISLYAVRNCTLHNNGWGAQSAFALNTFDFFFLFILNQMSVFDIEREQIPSVYFS